MKTIFFKDGTVEHIHGEDKRSAVLRIVRERLGEDCEMLVDDLLCEIEDQYFVSKYQVSHTQEICRQIESIRKSLHDTWLKAATAKKKPGMNTLLDVMSEAWRGLPDLKQMASLDEEFPDGDHSEDNLR